MSALRLDVFTGAQRELDNGGSFSPTTSTLIAGPTESVVVDTQYMADDVDELVHRIVTSGTTLTTIYVTHAHADHYFGLLRDFIAEVDAASGSRDLVERMQRRHPDLGNPSALVLSAVTAMKRRRT